jgi:hypothetical protein
MRRDESRDAGRRRSAGKGAGPIAERSRRTRATGRQDPRIRAAWRRASRAKRAFGVVAVVLFGSAMGLSRSTFAGHPKAPVRALSPPSHFVDIVRKNLLQAGLVAPANAPPGATTGVS